MRHFPVLAIAAALSAPQYVLAQVSLGFPPEGSATNVGWLGAAHYTLGARP